MKEFKLYIVLLLALLFLSDLSAQNRTIRLSSKFLLFDSAQAPKEFDFEPSIFKFEYPSIAFRKWKENRYFNEWEFGGKIKLFRDGEDKFDRFLMSLRYERGKYLFKKMAEKPFRVMYGYGIELYYLSEDITMSSFNIYPVKIRDIGIRPSINLQLHYHFSEQFNVNFTFLSINSSIAFNNRYVDNPALTVNQRRNNGLDFDLLRGRIIRLSIGYRLAPKGDE